MARDIVTDRVHNKISRRIGGPATFISSALKKQKIDVVMHTGFVVDVNIEVDEFGETGCVSAIPANEKPGVCQSGVAIISTLSHEWNPQEIIEGCEQTFLDVQGFVRGPDVLGRKCVWKDFRGDWIKKIKCLKTTELELSFLPKKSVEDQKTRMLLVTKGVDGVDVYVEGKLMSFRPPRVVLPRDTIGAGDTFFAHTIARMILGDAPHVAVVVALEETSRFLEKKVLGDSHQKR